jgi:hypothetical protein
MNNEQFFHFAVPHPSFAPQTKTFQRSNASTFQSPAFVPQTTNVEKSPITNNGARKLSLKSQESDLFLEKAFFNLFLLKNPRSIFPVAPSNREDGPGR